MTSDIREDEIPKTQCTGWYCDILIMRKRRIRIRIRWAIFVI